MYFEPMVRDIIQNEDAAAEPADTEAALKLLDELKPILKRSDAECLMFIDDLRAVPGSSEMITLMENFDFDSAYDELERIAEKLLKG